MNLEFVDSYDLTLKPRRKLASDGFFHGVCLYVFLHLQRMIPAWVLTVTRMLFVTLFGDVYVKMVSKVMESVARVSNPFNTHCDLKNPIK